MGQAKQHPPFLPALPQNMPVIQIIGTPEQQFEFFEWLERRDKALIREAIRQYEEQRNDPMGQEPEAAPAKYWAGKKMKGNGRPYSARSFQMWAKENGEVRMQNGMYTKDTGRRWLFG